MPKATYMGTVPLEWLRLPSGISQWEAYQTEDIFATNFITIPNDYLLTLGSAAIPPYVSGISSGATLPAYQLPTSTQIYIAGRDVLRWGGPNDPCEVDFDRYVFTPLPGRDVAAVSKAPKSEPHHLSDVPHLLDLVPGDWQEIFRAIKEGQFPR